MSEEIKKEMENKKAKFTVPEIKSQEITVQNALANTPACPSDPIDGSCTMYG